MAIEATEQFDDFIAQHQDKDVLRFIACGSVDDGKSTLIGRLLHDTQQLFDDQLAALKRDSRRHGTQGDRIDYALIVDGLAAEREQGITIDVAYRFFSTSRRTFIVADCPGHEQYTRNMATGASTADAAVLLIDARKGLSTQTRRHSLLLAMLGVPHIVLAINKMDLIGWSQGRYDAIMAEYRAFAVPLGFSAVAGIPLSALSGDNVVDPAVAASWYDGPTLLQYLEGLDVREEAGAGPFRLPVQVVIRPRHDFRGYAGLVTAGKARVGDPVRIEPSGHETRIARIVTFDGDLGEVEAGRSVTLTFVDDVDVSRGDVIAAAAEPPFVGDAVTSRLFWMSDQPLGNGTSLIVKLGTATVGARVADILGRVDPETGFCEPAKALKANDIGEVRLSLDRPVPFDPYSRSRDTGSFILIDREQSDTVGMGLVLATPEITSEREPVMFHWYDRVLAFLPRRLRQFAVRTAPAVFIAASCVLASSGVALSQTQLLNVSYDPTRELYREINQVFAQEWKNQSGETVVVRTSHGGSGAQARSVIDGLNADVVTLALAADIDAIAQLTKKIPADWQKRLPNNSSPYTSTIVFLVRKGNPKAIRDWDDLAKPGIQVVTPNPKTSGGARWNYLGAWGFALDKWKDETRARDLVAAIYKNVPVLDTGARGSTTTFAQRGIGDVLISWENEAFLSLKEFGEDKFDIVVPSVSILAEPPVALVDGNVDAKGTRKVAQAYLDFLYTPRAQAVIAKHFYRPSKPEAAAKEDLERLPKVKLFTIDEVFGGWGKVQKTHFDDGGIFDTIMKSNR
jgi:sulfate adenylyltransferase subunit 1